MKTTRLIGCFFLLAALWPMHVSAQEPAQTVLSTCVKKMTYAQLEIRGDELRFAKRYEDAIDCYKEADHRLAKNAALHNKIGIAYLMLGNYDRAENYFRNAVKFDKKFAEAYNNLGVISYTRRNYGGAVKNYKRALALNETNASFHSNLGTAWFAQKKLDRAMMEYTRALELDPDVVIRSATSGISARIAAPGERAKYMYMLAKLYAKRGDVDRCLMCLRKAKEEGYPKMADVYADEEFTNFRQDSRLMEIVPQPMR